MEWLKNEKDRDFADYAALWEWSVTDLEGFWASIWEYGGVEASESYSEVLKARRMPGAEWFPGARLNYAEHAFLKARPDEPAILHQSELRYLGEVSWGELREKTAALAAGLKDMGVGRGDRVVAYIPNIPEAMIALLACASLGAVWSSCSPDFGVRSVVDRFKQIESKVLLAVDGYRYGGKDYDRRDVVARLQREIPSLQQTIFLPYLSASLIGGKINIKDISQNWDEVLRLLSSIRLGTVSASMILGKLANYPRQSGLAKALREIGRIERTLFTLRWLQDPDLRTRVTVGLNKGEARNALARAVFFNRLGESRDRSYEDQMNRAGGLALLTAALSLWNAAHLPVAVEKLRDRGEHIPDEKLSHLSPLGWEHITLTGIYHWDLTATSTLESLLIDPFQ